MHDVHKSEGKWDVILNFTKGAGISHLSGKYENNAVCQPSLFLSLCRNAWFSLSELVTLYCFQLSKLFQNSEIRDLSTESEIHGAGQIPRRFVSLVIT